MTYPDLCLECMGDTLLQQTTVFLTYLLLFFHFLDKAVLLSLTTFLFILTSLGIAFIQKVETFKICFHPVV